MFKHTPLAGAALLALACGAVRAADAAAPAASVVPTAAPASAASAPVQLAPVEVKARRDRLDDARNSLSPETGSTVYRFDRTDIARLPLGDATPLNQVLLRAPGVVGDSFGQLHVRGDHANLQYRINGVVIPESISGFGQALDTRFAAQLNVLTGALPAQYGYRTAGIVDIRTRGPGGAGARPQAADPENAGSVDVVVGSRGHREASADVGGTAGRLQYFVTGSWLQNEIGIENPTASRNAVHDDTRQAKGFAYLSYLLGDQSRLSLMLASATSRFQIPNVPGEAPAFDVAGATVPASIDLDANQRERNTFEVLSFQSRLGDGTDYQVSLFSRNSGVHYRPDPIGDLAYNGVAADVQRKNVASGLQLDASRALGDAHTLRAGLFLQQERSTVDTASTVFPADADGNATSTVPIAIADADHLSGHLYGVYLQDEWQPTSALTVNYGVRYDRTTTVGTESQWSPRVGAVYQLGSDTRVHAGYARYFTPPPTEKIDTTSVAKFAGTTNALPSDANTAVRAERSHYVDVGVSHQLTPQVTVGADAYARRVAHLQDEGQFGNALVYSAFNFQRAKVMGLELSASYRGERLSGYANVGVSRAVGKGIESGQFNFDGDELAYISSHWVHLDHDQTVAAAAGVSYKLDDATTVGADVLYGSGLRRGFANTEHLAAAAQVNASIVRSFAFDALGRFDVHVSAINLLDRVAQLRDGSGIGVGAPQYAPRRTLYLGLSRPFTF